jgi:hypothetical protein
MLEAEVLAPETKCAFVVEIVRAAVTGDEPTVTGEAIVQLISPVAGGVHARETCPVNPLIPVTVIGVLPDCPCAAMVRVAFFERT